VHGWPKIGLLAPGPRSRKLAGLKAIFRQKEPQALRGCKNAWGLRQLSSGCRGVGGRGSCLTVQQTFPRGTQSTPRPDRNPSRSFSLDYRFNLWSGP
jgi:hypothetical protein